MHGLDTTTCIKPQGLKCTNSGMMARGREWTLLEGLGPASDLGVFNNNLANGYRAFAERYLQCEVNGEFKDPLPTSDAVWIDDPNMRQYIEDVHEATTLKPVCSVEEVVNMYHGPKRKNYQRACKKYYRDGVTKMDAILKSFVKFEKCSLLKAPRVINPRSLPYNLCLGRFLKQNEHEYFDGMARVWDQDVVVMKGMTAQETARNIKVMWDEFEDPIAIGGDAKKFDMHVRPQALMYEHVLYLRRFFDSYESTVAYYRWGIDVFSRMERMPEDDDCDMLCWLLVHQLRNTGVAYFSDGILKFTMEGTRSSGDLNTSLGNTTIMTAMTRAWCRETGVNIRFLNNGDDCTYIMERRDEQRWRQGMAEWFALRGFRMEFEDTVDYIEGIEFCQAHPVCVGGVWTMVRNLKATISKAAMCLLPQGNGVLRKWMDAVGTAEGSLTAGVPVHQEFAKALRRNGKKASNGIKRLVWRESNKYYNLTENVVEKDIDIMTRLSYERAFGVSPAAQMVLERHYASWKLSSSYGPTIQQWNAPERVGVAIDPCFTLV